MFLFFFLSWGSAMFLRCSYLFGNLSLDVLINKVLTQKNQCIHYDFSQMEPFESKLLRLCISWRYHRYFIWKPLKNCLCAVFHFLGSGPVGDGNQWYLRIWEFPWQFFFLTFFFAFSGWSPYYSFSAPNHPFWGPHSIQSHSLTLLGQPPPILGDLPPHLRHLPPLLKTTPIPCGFLTLSMALALAHGIWGTL